MDWASILWNKTSQKLRNCPNSRYSSIVKFGRNCENLVNFYQFGLERSEFITIMYGQTQNFFCHCHCHLRVFKMSSKIPLWGCSLVIVFLIVFCWSGHVFSSLWSNVWEVKSLKDCSLKVFSKCICHCHCLCVCLRVCVFVWVLSLSYRICLSFVTQASTYNYCNVSSGLSGEFLHIILSKRVHSDKSHTAQHFSAPDCALLKCSWRQ